MERGTTMPGKMRSIVFLAVIVIIAALAALSCGGGNTARLYQKAAKAVYPKVASKDLDWVGIGATRINGELVSAIFGDAAFEGIIFDPLTYLG